MKICAPWPGILFIAPRAAEGYIKSELVRAASAPRFSIDRYAAPRDRMVDAARHCIGILMHDQLHAGGFCHLLAHCVHGAEFPSGIDVQQREGRVPGKKAFRARCSMTALSLPTEYSMTGFSLPVTTSR